MRPVHSRLPWCRLECPGPPEKRTGAAPRESNRKNPTPTITCQRHGCVSQASPWHHRLGSSAPGIITRSRAWALIDFGSALGVAVSSPRPSSAHMGSREPIQPPRHKTPVFQTRRRPPRRQVTTNEFSESSRTTEPPPHPLCHTNDFRPSRSCRLPPRTRLTGRCLSWLRATAA
jgi:hypothetical protein